MKASKQEAKSVQKLTIKTPEGRQWLISNFEQISHYFSVSIIVFEQIWFF